MYEEDQKLCAEMLSLMPSLLSPKSVSMALPCSSSRTFSGCTQAGAMEGAAQNQQKVSVDR